MTALCLLAAATCTWQGSVGLEMGLPSIPRRVASKSVPAASKNKKEQTPCTINVLNEDPVQVLGLLSKQAELNVLLLDPPQVKITTNLRNVPFIEVLKHLSALMGATYLKVGSTYVVGKADRLQAAYPKEWDLSPNHTPNAESVRQENLVSEIYECNYVSALQISQALSQLFPKEKITIVAGPVQANPSVGSQQVDASTGSKTTVLTKEANDTSALAGKTLIMRGESALVREAMGLARRMDSIRPQVAIEVRVHDVLDSAIKEAGLSWNFGSFGVSERDNTGRVLGSFDRSPLNFSASIRALETQDKAKLLASPNISVLDGERAFVLVGDRIAFPVLVGFGQGNVPIFSKEEVRVGVYLQVAASVSNDGQITLSLYPQVSNIIKFTEINGASYPQIATREAQSTLRLLSGETVVMGGLMRTDETSTIEKVPLLGDLPFLGELFRRRKRTRSASQVVISITPRLIRANEPR